MKKILTAGALLFVLMTNLAVECDGTPPLGSSNYRNTDTSSNGIDTTEIKRLEVPVTVDLTFQIQEDTSNNFFKYVPVFAAQIHLVNTGLNVLTDELGCAVIKFTTDSIPFSFKYEITKDGYKSYSEYCWDTVTNISNTISIVRIK